MSINLGNYFAVIFLRMSLIVPLIPRLSCAASQVFTAEQNKDS